MPPLKYTPEAQRDIHRAWSFLAAHDTDVAQRAIQTIRAALRLLATHPEAGRPANGHGLAFREWVIDFGNSGYIALYHFEAHEVVILAVRHQHECGYTK